MQATELEVGKEYEVSWDDCCVAGSFAAELFEKVYTEDALEPYLSELRWSNGVTTNGETGFGYTYRLLEGSGEAEHDDYVAVEP
jgi:hypothetical protein